MTLRDLDAKFVRLWNELDQHGHEYVDDLGDAEGVMFLCPKCFAANGGPVGTHAVICWFVGRVPDDETPGPGRWIPEGEGLDDLTFVPGEPPRATSVLLTGDGCGAHFHVRGGKVEDC